MPIECVPRNSPCGHSSEKNTLSRLMHRNPCRGPSTPQEAASQLLVPLRMTTITYAFPAPAAAFPARTTSKTLCPTADAHKIYLVLPEQPPHRLWPASPDPCHRLPPFRSRRSQPKSVPKSYQQHRTSQNSAVLSARTFRQQNSEQRSVAISDSWNHSITMELVAEFFLMELSP